MSYWWKKNVASFGMTYTNNWLRICGSTSFENSTSALPGNSEERDDTENNLYRTKHRKSCSKEHTPIV